MPHHHGAPRTTGVKSRRDALGLRTCVDSRTIGRDYASTAIRRNLAIPSDHGEQLASSWTRAHTIAWNEQECARRAGPKPIAWALKETEKERLNAAISELDETWSMSWDTDDYTTALQRLLPLGYAPKAARQSAKRPEIVADFRHRLRAMHDDDICRQLKHEPFKARHSIERQRSRNYFAYILTHLRGCGWGKEAIQMQKRSPAHMFTQLRREDGTYETRPTASGDAAARYYKTLFDHSDKDPEFEACLTEMMNASWDLWEHSGAVVTAENIAQAIYSRRPHKTTGTSMVPTEVWRQLADSSAHAMAGLTWAANKRLANNAATPSRSKNAEQPSFCDMTMTVPTNTCSERACISTLGAFGSSATGWH